MKASGLAAAVLVLTGLLSWLAYHGTDPDNQYFNAALGTLSRLEFANADLQRNVLNARVGILRDYDTVDRSLDVLERHSATLNPDQADPAAIDALRDAVAHEDDLVETFKTSNALLQNALAYFGDASIHFAALRLQQEQALGPDLSADPGVDPAAATDSVAAAATALTTAMLRLTFDTGASAIRQVDQDILQLAAAVPQASERADVRGLLEHGRLLSTVLPATDRAVRALQQVPLLALVHDVRMSVIGKRARSAEQAAQFRAVLYFTSLLLVVLLAALGLQLLRYIRMLRRRARLEHEIATASIRLADSGAAGLDEQIGAAVARFAAVLGAERAYAIYAGRQTVAKWMVAKRDDPGASADPAPDHYDWPEQAAAIASRADHYGAGTVLIRRVSDLPAGADRTMLQRHGLQSLLSVSDAGFAASGVTIGFETLGRRLDLDPDELKLLRVAVDTMAGAVARITLEQERALLGKQLQQARRMETIGALTTGIAHNFNNIIGAILGFAEMEQPAPSRQHDKNIAGIQIAAERGRDLIDQLMNFGCRRAGWLKHVDVAPLLSETVSLLRASLPGDAVVQLAPVPHGAAVAGNHAELQQVVLNLCNNAIQASEDRRPVVDIAVDCVTLDQPQTLRQGELRPGAYVRLTVQDHGRGMEASTIGRLFEPFFTERPNGNGLGLATVREIVDSHGGAIDITSSRGTGSRFTIWLPKADPEPTPHEPGGALVPSRGQTVLIINLHTPGLLRDEEIVAALGYEPVGFAGPAADIAGFCRAQAGRSDAIIVSDAGPSGRALEVVAAARRAAPGLPIILAISAVELDAGSLVQVGVTEIVRKPIGSAETALALSRCLSKPPGGLRPGQRRGAAINSLRN